MACSRKQPVAHRHKRAFVRFPQLAIPRQRRESTRACAVSLHAMRCAWVATPSDIAPPLVCVCLCTRIGAMRRNAPMRMARRPPRNLTRHFYGSSRCFRCCDQALPLCRRKIDLTPAGYFAKFRIWLDVRLGTERTQFAAWQQTRAIIWAIILDRTGSRGCRGNCSCGHRSSQQ